MPRFHNINGEVVQFTAEEEAPRDVRNRHIMTHAPAALTELRRKRDNLLKGI